MVNKKYNGLLWLFIILNLLFSINCSKDISTKKNESKEKSDVIKNLHPPKRNYWPTNGWQKKTLAEANLDPKKFTKVIDYAFTRIGKERERKGIRTDGMVVVKNGYVVFEKYVSGYTKDSKHLLWSVSKSFVNALYGIAEKENFLSINDYASKYYKVLDDEKNQKNKITIKNLLNMSSGLYWSEGYESSPLKSTVIAMLYTSGRRDMAAFTAGQEMRATPGTYVYYSSGDTNILMKILQNVLKEKYDDYAWEKLFQPLGIKNVTWEQDASGNYIGSSYLYMTPREMAKLGYLYLNNGKWNGKQILTSQWVTFTRTPAKGYKTTPKYKGIKENIYTAQWYANTGVANAGIPKPWPDAPDDTFAASGHWGQAIFVIPSWDIVIAYTGDTRDHSFDKNHFLKLIKESLK